MDIFKQTYSYKAMAEYNAKSYGEPLSRDDEDWDDLYCCISIELDHLHNLWSDYLWKVRKLTCYNAGFELDNDYKRWIAWKEGINRLSYFWYNAYKVTSNLEDFETLYRALRQYNQVTFEQLFSGEMYSHPLGGGRFEPRVIC